LIIINIVISRENKKKGRKLKNNNQKIVMRLMQLTLPYNYASKFTNSKKTQNKKIISIKTIL